MAATSPYGKGSGPFPFANFNRTGLNYTGPNLGDVAYVHLWSHLDLMKRACDALIAPDDGSWTYGVGECVLRNLSEQVKANLSQYTYFLTLWPALIALFASFGPDASDAAFDNLLWAILLSITSGSMAGFQTPANIPHNISVYSYASAQAICARGDRAMANGELTLSAWRQKIGRFSPRRRQCSAGFARSQWVVLVLSTLGWAAFLGLLLYGFRYSLSFAASTAFTFAQPGIWYYLSFVPGLMEALTRIVCHNIELWEPVPSQDGSFDPDERKSSRGVNVAPVIGTMNQLASVGSPQGPRASFADHLYVHVEQPNALSLWRRVFVRQMQGRPYRLLVHPHPEHWLVDVWQYLTMFARFALITVGSIQQASFMLYPPDIIIIQSVLLVFTTTSPRILWPNYWIRDRRGADLVVFLHRSWGHDSDS